jgi:hypothetical protein
MMNHIFEPYGNIKRGNREGDFFWFETLPFGCGHYNGGINLNERALLINSNTWPWKTLHLLLIIDFFITLLGHDTLASSINVNGD